jgi:hypothetical protein
MSLFSDSGDMFCDHVVFSDMSSGSEAGRLRQPARAPRIETPDGGANLRALPDLRAACQEMLDGGVDGSGVFEGGHVAGVGDFDERGVGQGGGHFAHLRGRRDGVVLTDEEQGGDVDAPQAGGAI